LRCSPLVSSYFLPILACVFSNAPCTGVPCRALIPTMRYPTQPKLSESVVFKTMSMQNLLAISRPLLVGSRVPEYRAVSLRYTCPLEAAPCTPTPRLCACSPWLDVLRAKPAAATVHALLFAYSLTTPQVNQPLLACTAGRQPAANERAARGCGSGAFFLYAVALLVK
jgi:hypothetical protein